MYQVIVTKLTELFPSITIYDNEIPVELIKPAFFIQVKNQNYNKLLGSKYCITVSFDITYYSNAGEQIMNDCFEKGLILLKEFDLKDGYMLRNKKTEIVDKLLHFTFEIQHNPKNEELFTKMQKQQIKTNL
ncbi:MAG: hypothetical protein K0S41_485 [Anaerocolumna sp.]|jgi:hypothetical protein|nr:hypothetical protein [Anaerocolumna sp.]